MFSLNNLCFLVAVVGSTVTETNLREELVTTTIITNAGKRSDELVAVVPFNVTLPVTTVTIHGIIYEEPTDTNSLIFQFQSSPSPVAEMVALQVRTEVDQVVRRSWVNAGWTQVETSGGNPIRRNVDFKIEVYITSSKFMIYFDGEHFADYVSPVPLEKITHLQVGGVSSEIKGVDVTVFDQL